RNFDAAAVARFGERDVTRLLKHPGIVRNRLKIKSAIGNARALLAVAAEHGSFDAWIWNFIGGRTIAGKARGRADMPARTPLPDRGRQRQAEAALQAKKPPAAVHEHDLAAQDVQDRLQVQAHLRGDQRDRVAQGDEVDAETAGRVARRALPLVRETEVVADV